MARLIELDDFEKESQNRALTLLRDAVKTVKNKKAHRKRFETLRKSQAKTGLLEALSKV